jgi:hypothetical protein
MRNCEQTKGLSIMQHGESVWDYTQKILNREEGLRIPKWLSENFDFIISNIHSLDTIKDYNVYHDCGKPYCLEIDSEGRRHFPNHAEVSKSTWLSFSDDKAVADLIGWDMVMHTYTADQIKDLNLSIVDYFTLLVTALAEVHSNASMFGGIESISFKSKWKKIDKRGNMLIKMFKT